MSETSLASGAQTVSRAIQALKLIANQHGPGLRLSDLAEALELPRPTVHRLLKALVDEGMLDRPTGSRRYILGAFVLEMGLISANALNLHRRYRPILQRLAERTGDTSFLFIRSGNDSVCVDRVQGTYPIQTPSVPIGGQHPLGVTAGGLALLSALNDADAERVLDTIAPRLDDYGHLDRRELDRLRRLTKKNGYALIGNHAVPGVAAMGLPIRTRIGTAVAAVAVASTESRMQIERAGEIVPALREAAKEASSLIQV